jgi:hypothetical protein
MSLGWRACLGAGWSLCSCGCITAAVQAAAQHAVVGVPNRVWFVTPSMSWACTLHCARTVVVQLAICQDAWWVIIVRPQEADIHRVGPDPAE